MNVEFPPSSDDPKLDENAGWNGIPYCLFKQLYIHLRGVNSLPASLIATAALVLETMKCGVVSKKRLIERIECGELIDFNRVVLWGVNRNRKLSYLFSEVTPNDYNPDSAKKFFLNHARGFYFKSKEKYDDSYIMKCQACRNMRFKNLLEFMQHLNRETAEITYMCRSCGFLKFTNFCALAYHIFSDDHFKPTNEYCVVCKSYHKSLADHLVGQSKYLNSWRAKCSSCDFVAYTKCSYSFHLAYHIRELPYICPECGEYFIFKANLEEHIKNKCYFENKLKFFVCTSCYMLFSYVEHYYTHVATEHYQRRVRCLICHNVFPAQRDFIEHRSKYHPESECKYQIIHYCELCPNLSFRGVSLQKHLSTHAENINSFVFLYKCVCEFYTRHKEKFIKHKENEECRAKSYTRHQIFKICSKCDEVQSFNYLKRFYCEDCQVILQPELSLMNYYCEICQLVIDYNWDSVLDHFSLFHKKVDLLSISHNVMMIICERKIAPGRYLNKSQISQTDFDGITVVIDTISAKKGRTKEFLLAHGIRVQERNGQESLTSSLSASDLSQKFCALKVRTPETINATIEKDASPTKAPSDTCSNLNPNLTALLSSMTPTVITPAQTPNITKSNPVPTPDPNITPVFSKDSIDEASASPTVLYCCRKCNFTSISKSIMNQHELKHNNKLFQCTECDNVYLSNSDLNDHLNNAHGICLVVENEDNVKSFLHENVQKILKKQIMIKEKSSHSSSGEGKLAVEEVCVVLSSSDSDYD